MYKKEQISHDSAVLDTVFSYLHSLTPSELAAHIDFCKCLQAREHGKTCEPKHGRCDMACEPKHGIRDGLTREPKYGRRDSITREPKNCRPSTTLPPESMDAALDILAYAYATASRINRQHNK